MTLDLLPDQFEQFVLRARAVIDQQIAKAKNLVDAANAEKTSAQNALTTLQAQLRETKADLDRSREYLQRASTLAGLDSQITQAGKELAQLKSETAKEAKALEALAKQRTEAESRLVALGNEAQRQLAIRTEGEAAMNDIKMKLAQIQIGVRP